MLKKKRVYVYILAIVAGIIFWLNWCAIIVGPVTFNCDNFAVDSQGNLYIGQKDFMHNSIFVYQDGALLRSMPAISDRAYAFIIQPDDTILWSNSLEVIETDLYGNEKSRTEDENSYTYRKLKKNREFTASDGTIYSKQLGFGTFKIYKNDIVIYQHPAYNQCFLIVTIISGIFLFPCILWLIKTEG